MGTPLTNLLNYGFRHKRKYFLLTRFHQTASQQLMVVLGIFLVKSGASLNSDNGVEALDISVSYGYPEMVELLLVNGVSADKVDYSGNSILHTAVEISHEIPVGGDIVSIAILKNCQPNTEDSVLTRKNREGLNPLDIAIKKNKNKDYSSIIDALKEYGLSVSKTLSYKNSTVRQRRGRRLRKGAGDFW